MLDLYFGWAYTADADGIFHILKTGLLATSWKDISPPQPLNPNSNWFTAEANFNDQDHGWVAYNDTDLIWRTVDGGITWEPARLEYETRLGSMIHSIDNDHVWFFQFLDAGMQKVHVALYSSSDGGRNLDQTCVDPMTVDNYSIQGFDKTGVDFSGSRLWLADPQFPRCISGHSSRCHHKRWGNLASAGNSSTTISS